MRLSYSKSLKLCPYFWCFRYATLRYGLPVCFDCAHSPLSRPFPPPPSGVILVQGLVLIMAAWQGVVQIRLIASPAVSSHGRRVKCNSIYIGTFVLFGSVAQKTASSI
jgi:hypothetical protein